MNRKPVQEPTGPDVVVAGMKKRGESVVMVIPGRRELVLRPLRPPAPANRPDAARVAAWASWMLLQLTLNWFVIPQRGNVAVAANRRKEIISVTLRTVKPFLAVSLH